MKKRGRGIATIMYPSGFNGGGDPDQVILRVKLDGSIEMSNASCEMGQGVKNIARQFAAEALDVPIDRINFFNGDTESAAYSMDTAGSRTTYIVGYAAIKAAEKLKEDMKRIVANNFGCEMADLEVAEGKVFIKENKEKAMTYEEIALASTFSGDMVIGAAGHLAHVGAPRDPETGRTNPGKTLAWGTSVIDVDVDTETGVVEVVNIYNCYDIGTVINPLQAEGQVIGGEIMGIGMALFEDLTPFYPHEIDTWTGDFTDYIVPTFCDQPKVSEIEFYENYDPNGPFGAKGMGEMVSDTQAPAIANAIYEAVGVWVDSLPITPEKVLRLLDEK